MPYLKIETNVQVKPQQHTELLEHASSTVAELLGKPESYVMVALQDSVPMLFAGSNAPLAYLELKSIGLPRERTTAISAGLTAMIGERLGIVPERVYIEFADAERPMWGWSDRTF
jgi:phenylpyruvate tautomerase PptA (4-oxalocrotonate tautomerase family)